MFLRRYAVTRWAFMLTMVSFVLFALPGILVYTPLPGVGPIAVEDRVIAYSTLGGVGLIVTLLFMLAVAFLIYEFWLGSRTLRLNNKPLD